MARDSVTIQLILEGRDAKRTVKALEREFGDLERAGVKTTRNIDKETKRLSDTNKRASNTLRNGLIAGYAALGFAAQQAVSRAIEEGKAFEQQLASLSAITGIVDNNLDRLGDNAIDLSKQYGIAATQIIEANKLVASQLAERIDFQTEEGFQQLQQVSEQAIVLATAAGTDLANAVETTTSVINQFNLEASESERVINTLAAGAKFGAAEVPAIGRALVNAGAAAAGAGASIETTNAAIQVLAANGQVGERAGTALRSIFTRLQTESEKLAELGLGEVNVRANGLTETLRQLAPAVDNTTELAEIFGAEAINQIQILIRNADAVASLEEKVTGTGIAYEQAAIQLDTYEGATNRLTQTVNGELIQAFQESNGVLVETVNLLIKLTEITSSGIKGINRFAQDFRRTAEAVGFFNAVIDELIDDIPGANALQSVLEFFGATTNRQLQELFDTIDEGTVGIKANITNTVEQAREYARLRDEAGRSQDEIDSFNRLIVKESMALREASDEFDFYIEQLKEQREETEEGSFQYIELTEKINQATEAYDLISDSIPSVNSLLNENAEVTLTAKERAEAATIALLKYSAALTAASRSGRQEDDSPAPPDRQEQGVRPEPGSIAALENQISLLKSAQRNLNLTAEGYQELQTAIDGIQKGIDETKGETEGVTEETRALLGVANLVGNAFLEMAIHGRELSDVLKGILAQLASKAFIIGIGTLLTGGIPGGGTFFEALFSGFAKGVTNFKGGNAIVGEEGPELVNLPRGANVITNENTRRLIDSANKIGHSPSSMANNIANTSVQNISQRVDLGGVSQEVGRAVSQAMSGARLVVGDMGELMVEFRRESKDQKALGGKSYIPFNDI